METLILTAVIVLAVLALCIRNIVAGAKARDKERVILNAAGAGGILLLVLLTVVVVIGGRG